MAEVSKVRLVRCPKCENVLPELPNFSVYQCGGCGAVLRAKMESLKDGLLDISDDEKGREGSEKGVADISSTSETQRESDGLEVISMTKERLFEENEVDPNSSSSLRTESKDVLINSDRIRRGETVGLRTDRSNQVGICGDEYRRCSKVPIDCGVWGNDHGFNMSRPKYIHSSVENELEEIKPPIGSLRSRPIMDHWSMGRNGLVAFPGNDRGVAEQGRFAAFPYPDEGPSNYAGGCFYDNCEQMRNCDGLTMVKNLENNRAELLKKLDELKDQLSRSCDLAEIPKERVAVDRRMAPPPPDIYASHGASMPEGLTNLCSVNSQPPTRDKYVPKPPYFGYNQGFVPHANNHALDMQDFNSPPRQVQNKFLGYEDTYRPQMFRRPPHQPPHLYSKQPYHDHFHRQYIHFNQDPLVSCPHETVFHQPAILSNRRPGNAVFYHHVNSSMYGPQGYNSEGLYPSQLHSRDRQLQTRSSSDPDVDNGAFGHNCPRRVVVARVCYPVAGGAPFITCCNCFELLKVPRKLLVMGKNQRKMRCGACSSVILFELENKGLVVSVPAQIMQDDGSCEMLNDTLVTSRCCSNVGSKTCSDDYDNSSYNFHLTNAEPKLMSRDPHSSSSSFSEDKGSPDSVIVRIDVSKLPSKDNVPLPPQEHTDSSSSNNVVSRYGKGNKSKCSDQEKLVLDRTTSRQNSVKDESVATEMDVSFNDFLNSCVSQDSMEVSKEEGRPRINKGHESFFAGLFKKSFKDFSMSNQSVEHGRPSIFINGKLIPDRVVKKAEKLAGPIQPGDYWYDFRAGFWGVIGQPCLGIIPPFIEEFNYPMPENCGAGNTGVFVNGRELHQKDLDLLAARGLPITRNQSYLVDICGIVLDEETGEELDNLGKLAPTVERVKHGFGMKVPRAVA